jgi:hypothetical protein
MFKALSAFFASRGFQMALHGAITFASVAVSATVTNLVQNGAFTASAPTQNQLILAAGGGVLAAAHQMFMPCNTNQSSPQGGK